MTVFDVSIYPLLYHLLQAKETPCSVNNLGTVYYRQILVSIDHKSLMHVGSKITLFAVLNSLLFKIPTGLKSSSEYAFIKASSL